MQNHVSIVEDGERAMQFPRREGPYTNAPRPDLILLDLFLPRKNGHEVLAEITADAGLRTIPVVVLTASGISEDVKRAYNLSANCFITKPVEASQFLSVVKVIEASWICVVRLPESVAE